MKKVLSVLMAAGVAVTLTACGGNQVNPDYPDPDWEYVEDEDIYDETGYDESGYDEAGYEGGEQLSGLLAEVVGVWTPETPGVFTLTYTFNSDYTWQWSSDGGNYYIGTYELLDDKYIVLTDSDGGETTLEYVGEERIVDDEGATWVPYGRGSTYDMDDGPVNVLDDVNYMWRLRDTDNYDSYYNFSRDQRWYLTNDSGSTYDAEGNYEYDGTELVLYYDGIEDTSVFTYSSSEGTLTDSNGNVYIIYGPAENG